MENDKKSRKVFFNNIDTELLAEFKTLAARSRLSMRDIFIDVLKKITKKDKYEIN
ncbi:MAG: hypothetical protein PHX04_06290 [Bacilli bacterium]|nr:hypothetical protein [Bacilli bacterium]